MTHAELLRDVLTSVRECLDAIDTGSDDSYERVQETLVSWIGIEQLVGLSELIAKAWWERDPSNRQARLLVINQLVAAGEMEEARRVELGSMPEDIGELSDSELARMGERTLRTAKSVDTEDNSK